jgi:hypothetical protein
MVNLKDFLKGIFNDPKIYIGEYLSNYYNQWLDACWFKGDLIPASNISGLGDGLAPITVTATATATYTIPAGFAMKEIYAIISGDDTTIQAGSTEGGEDHFSAIPLLDNITTYASFVVLADTDTTVHFTIPQNTSPDKITIITIYIQKMTL